MDDDPAGLETPKFRKMNPCTRMGSDEYIDSTFRTGRVTYGPFVNISNSHLTRKKEAEQAG